MSTIDDKLRRGYDLTTRSGGDQDRLGAAMVAFHSALENYFDEFLGSLPQIDADVRELLTSGRIRWVQRANLALEHGLISREQRRMILDVNRLRQEFAHGEPFSGSAESVEAYGRFVTELCGRAVPRPARRRRAAAAPATAPADDPLATEPITAPAMDAWRERNATRQSRRIDLLSLFPPQQIALLLTVSLLLAIGVWVVFDWVLRPPDPAAVSIVPERTVIAPPTAVATAIPITRRAQIVRLGGGPGWLRERPSFDAATMPIRLEEGTLVTLVNREPVEAEGTTWQLVAAGGYEGWCPLNNHEPVGGPAS
ncbi:MAG TPA: hypothetical protein PKC19_01705 [Roseiflexaceae bacterium]|nr:hypothetical protein [Roseiflexaceae bacterium]